MQHYKRLQKISFLLLFSATHTMFGQFNTLSPQLQPEKKKYEKYTIIENKQVDAEKKMQSGLWHKLFKSEKATLRKEVDSLKKAIEQKDKQLSIKKIEDSIVLALVKKSILSSVSSKKEAEPSQPTPKTPKIAMPLNGDLTITSSFGERFHPILKENKYHNGIDLRANNQYVYSVLDGVISNVGWDYNGGGGLFIKVRHNNAFETTYCHLSEVYYRQGEPVKAGFVIARSGNTGLSTAPHLHFSVKEKDKYINPINFLNDLITINNKL